MRLSRLSWSIITRIDHTDARLGPHSLADMSRQHLRPDEVRFHEPRPPRPGANAALVMLTNLSTIRVMSFMNNSSYCHAVSWLVTGY
eukprot:13116-Eustigmatos_ZCMA.PRE.1